MRDLFIIFSSPLLATISIDSADASVTLSAFSVTETPQAVPTSATTAVPHTFDDIFEFNFDCTVTISPQTNLNTTISNLPPGNNTVCLLPGTYSISQSLHVPSDTTITGMRQGINRNMTTIALANNVNKPVIYVTSKNDVEIKHLKIDGNGANQSASPNPEAVRISDSSDIELFDLEINRASRMAVTITGSQNIEVLGSVFKNMDFGNDPLAVGTMWISHTNSMIAISDNYILGRGNGPGGDGGIDCYYSDHVTVSDNTIEDTGESSIYTAADGCTNMQILDNDIYNSNEWGIDVTLGANHVTIDGNYIDNTYYGAMVLWQVNDVTVTNNVMVDGHAYPPSVPCKTITVDSSTNINIDFSNTADSSPLYCNRP